MDAREARKQRRQEQVRADILQAARAVLLRRGISGLTLSAVGRELQLTKAALYHYFASKEALVFELIYGGLASHAAVVGAAVTATDNGPDALEALIRTSAEHYGEHRDDLRLAYLAPQVGTTSTMRFDADMLARIRPFNDQIYGAVGNKIRDDQAAGRLGTDVQGRRLAFLAHVAVLGMLTVEGLVEVADDTPLIHDRNDMVDELVRTFRTRLDPPSQHRNIATCTTPVGS